jgi:hypothetical protein
VSNRFWLSSSSFSFKNPFGKILLHAAADVNGAAKNISHIREMTAFQIFPAKEV